VLRAHGVLARRAPVTTRSHLRREWGGLVRHVPARTALDLQRPARLTGVRRCQVPVPGCPACRDLIRR
jgi:hypothetical protein